MHSSRCGPEWTKNTCFRQVASAIRGRILRAKLVSFLICPPVLQNCAFRSGPDTSATGLRPSSSVTRFGKNLQAALDKVSRAAIARIHRAVGRFARYPASLSRDAPEASTAPRFVSRLFDTVSASSIRTIQKSNAVTNRQYSRRVKSPPAGCAHVGRRRRMRDLMADWNKWSSAERLLAVVLMLMLIGLPLRVFIAGAPS